MASKITMELFETDENALIEFINRGSNEPDLILYNFATDLLYAEFYQKDLLEILIPSYIKAIVVAYEERSSDALEVVSQFNAALFVKKKNFLQTLGGDRFSEIIGAYESVLIQAVNADASCRFSWVPLFNTILSIDSSSLDFIMKSLPSMAECGKVSFFLYLYCFTVNKRDNLLEEINARLFNTGVVWSFDSDQLGRFFWREKTLMCFSQMITTKVIRELFVDVEKSLSAMVGEDEIFLLAEYFATDSMDKVFDLRKAEFLDKISCPEELQYWGDSFS